MQKWLHFLAHMIYEYKRQWVQHIPLPCCSVQRFWSIDFQLCKYSCKQGGRCITASFNTVLTVKDFQRRSARDVSSLRPPVPPIHQVWSNNLMMRQTGFSNNDFRRKSARAVSTSASATHQVWSKRFTGRHWVGGASVKLNPLSAVHSVQWIET